MHWLNRKHYRVSSSTRSIRVNSLELCSIETHWNLATSPIHLNPNVSPYLFPISLFRDELLDFNLRSILFKPHSARSTATRCSNSRDSSRRLGNKVKSENGGNERVFRCLINLERSRETRTMARSEGMQRRQYAARLKNR